MSSIEELEQRIAALERELYEVRNIAYGAYESIDGKKTAQGYKFNLLHSQTLDSKLNWLAVNFWNDHPARYYINDKYLFKYYMDRMFGEGLTVPLLSVYDRAEDIDFDELPEKFVLKKTLGGAAIEVVLVDKNTSDLGEIRKKAEEWMRAGTQAPSRLIAEEYLEYEGDYIIDYKAYVINGKVRLYMCGVMHKEGGHRQYAFYDADWNKYDFAVGRNVMPIARPDNLEELVATAERIGQHFPFIRVDFYIAGGKQYIGELTGLPFNARAPYGFQNDLRFGKLLKLPTMEEVQGYFEEAYNTFPELREHPIFLRGKNPYYRIVAPMDGNDYLPLPPSPFMQPKK